MNLSTIERYVADKNNWARLFGSPELSLLNKQDRQKLAASLDADLSPENLTCDGELPRAEVQRRYNFLTRAAKELKALDPSVVIYDFG